MNDFIIVGAGISGLTLGWALRERGARIRVIEADPRPGGKIWTQRREGFVLDAGPNSLLDRGEGLRQLIDELGLRARVVEANPLAKRRFVSKEGRVIALPSGPLNFLGTPLFSFQAKLRLLAEPWQPVAKADESIASFVRRRLGPEFLAWAVDPFISGVYAGDPERLSVRAATGRIHALEAEAGSLLRGALRRARQGRRTGPVPKGKLISFVGGMGELPAALATALDEDIALESPVISLRRTDRHWDVETPTGTEKAAAIVLATPAKVTAQLLEPFDVHLAEMLRAIEYPGVVSMALGFAREQVQHPLDGFGMLIPGQEGLETLGVLFSSTLFPGRAPEGHVLMTAFIGGARNPEVTAREEAALVSRVVEDLRPLLGLTGMPGFTAVNRWPHAIPQYTVGHLDRMLEIENSLAALPDLYTVSNWRGGIAVGDCVNNALDLAGRLMPESAQSV